MTQETQRQQIERWLADGETWVGVFENHDLGSANVGRRVAVPYDVTVFDKAQVGSDRAPEMVRKFGHLPWQLILIAKCRTADEAEAVLANGVKQVDTSKATA